MNQESNLFFLFIVPVVIFATAIYNSQVCINVYLCILFLFLSLSPCHFLLISQCTTNLTALIAYSSKSSKNMLFVIVQNENIVCWEMSNIFIHSIYILNIHYIIQQIFLLYFSFYFFLILYLLFYRYLFSSLFRCFFLLSSVSQSGNQNEG